MTHLLLQFTLAVLRRPGLCVALFLALSGVASAGTGTGTTSHVGPAPSNHMRQGGTGTVTFSLVNNGPGATSGTMTVAGTMPAGLTLGTVPRGTPWNCTAVSQTVTCTNTSSIGPGSSYQLLTLPVNVAGSAASSVTVNGFTFSGAGVTSGAFSADTIVIDPAPILSLTKSHTGAFTQGSTATWNLLVTNNAATAAGGTDGSTVTVVDTLPAGYSASSATGTNWTCVPNGQTVTCTSTGVVAGNGGQFPIIALTVNVPTTSASSVTNNAKAYGGGDLVHTNSSNGASGSDTLKVVQVPTSISLTAGDNQTVAVNTAFPTAFSVTVRDAGNSPISGLTVTFTAPSFGASGTFAGGTNTKTATTSASGVATATTYTANATAGSYNVGVAVGSLTNNFSATNLAGAATQMTANAGTTPQSATITTTFSSLLRVTVRDAHNNPVSGVTVTFTAPGTGASGTFPGPVTTAAVVTNGSGIATAPAFTANATSGGPYNVTAQATGLPTVNFSLTNTNGVAPAITLNPTDQTVNIGQTATFTAAATGTPTPTVQWQSSTDGGATFQNVAGATTPTLTLSNVAAIQNGNKFRAVFTNAAGPATTTTATMTVLDGTTLVELLVDGSVRVSFTFPSVAGRPYQVQSKDSLAPASWDNRASGTVDAQGKFMFTESPPLPGMRFYHSIFP